MKKNDNKAGGTRRAEFQSKKFQEKLNFEFAA